MGVVDGQMGIHVRQEYIVLGIDPGRDKTGFAFVDDRGALLASGIFPSNEADNFFSAVLAGREYFSSWLIEGSAESLHENLLSAIKFIAIGDGTHSKNFTERVRESLPCEILTVDERNTTLEARGLYWKIHRPSFLMRLIPEGVRVPARVLDDLAAWAIALRGLKKYRDIRRNKL